MLEESKYYHQDGLWIPSFVTKCNRNVCGTSERWDSLVSGGAIIDLISSSKKPVNVYNGWDMVMSKAGWIYTVFSFSLGFSA